MDKKPLSIADLPISPVNPDSPIPLYHQIEADLRHLIAEQHLSPSDILPPELELSRAYGVGRHTMREALSRLVADDLITRKAGLGTMVNAQPDRTHFYLDRSFTRQMAELGRQAHSQILDFRYETIDENFPGVFHQQLGVQAFIIERLRFGDDEPIGIQSSILVSTNCPGIDRHNFAQESLYEVLAADYQIMISQIQHTVSAASATDLQAELLQIPPQTALLVVFTAAYTDSGALIEFTTSHYRADQYTYSTTHTYLP